VADTQPRHRRDTTSLVLGLLLIAAAGLFLLDDLSDASLDARWVAPVVLVVVGLGGLLSAVRRPDRSG
jgi:hypothetical protein